MFSKLLITVVKIENINIFRTTARTKIYLLTEGWESTGVFISATGFGDTGVVLTLSPSRLRGIGAAGGVDVGTRSRMSGTGALLSSGDENGDLTGLNEERDSGPQMSS